MARIIFGAGVSHSPVLALDTKDWEERSNDDKLNQRLNLSDGTYASYQELERRVGTPYADVAQLAVYDEKSSLVNRALDRVADDLEEAAPDVVVIVGDDQEELFSRANQPSIALYTGDAITTNDHYAHGHANWMQAVAPGYAMDSCRSFPASPAFALDVVRGLIERGVDISTSAEVVDPKVAGFGHAYGFIIQRLFKGRTIPVLPVLLNTYYPPNVPTAARCFAVGEALRGAIGDVPADLRVALIASGGLSHFVVDEELDRRVLRGIAGEPELLKTLPRGSLNDGSSEILNWVTVAGAIGRRPIAWQEYCPIFRTPAGTGVGTAFVVWKLNGD